MPIGEEIVTQTQLGLDFDLVVKCRCDYEESS